MKQKPDVRWPNLPVEVYRARIERTRECLADRGIDTIGALLADQLGY